MKPDLAAALIGEVGSIALLTKAPRTMTPDELRRALLDLEAEHAKAHASKVFAMCELIAEVSHAVGQELSRRINPAAAIV